jgi:4-hydroxy-tetrahydrodipicolinate synthase
MTDSGDIAWDEWAALLEAHAEAKTPAVLVAGTTGEHPTLSEMEWSTLISTAVEMAQKRFLVIAGTGCNSTQRAAAYTHEAQFLGADAGLAITPYLNKPTQAGLIRHYTTLADVGLPLILYNVPSRTVCDCGPDTVLTLSKHPHVVGIKECTDDLARVVRYREEAPHLQVFTGNDGSSLAFMKAGGQGVISVTANIVSHSMQRYLAACLALRWEEAERLHAQLSPLHAVLFIESNPIPVKWALHHLKKISSGIRLPLTELDAVHYKTLTHILQEVLLHETL